MRQPKLTRNFEPWWDYSTEFIPRKQRSVRRPIWYPAHSNPINALLLVQPSLSSIQDTLATVPQNSSNLAGIVPPNQYWRWPIAYHSCLGVTCWIPIEVEGPLDEADSIFSLCFGFSSLLGVRKVDLHKGCHQSPWKSVVPFAILL